MSNNRIKTATINNVTYALGEEQIGLATETTAGILKVGTTANTTFSNVSSNYKSYKLNRNTEGVGYVNIPESGSTSTIKPASTTTTGGVRIPINSGLKVESSNGNLVVNLDPNRYGIGTSQTDDLNPSYLMLEKATYDSLGGIKIGYTPDSSFSNKYGVELDNDGKAYVEVNINTKGVVNLSGNDNVDSTSGNNPQLKSNTIFTNLNKDIGENDSKSISIKLVDNNGGSEMKIGDECEFLLKGIETIKIDTAYFSGLDFNTAIVNTNIATQQSLYWEINLPIRTLSVNTSTGKAIFDINNDMNTLEFDTKTGIPKFDKTKIYKIKFLKIDDARPTSNKPDHKLGKYIISCSLPYYSYSDIPKI